MDGVLVGRWEVKEGCGRAVGTAWWAVMDEDISSLTARAATSPFSERFAMVWRDNS